MMVRFEILGIEVIFFLRFWLYVIIGYVKYVFGFRK